MPKLLHRALTAQRVTAERRFGRFADGNGLYLHVQKPHGAKFFEWRGTVKGKRRTYGIGPVRFVTLATARDTAEEWSRIARNGGDPRRAQQQQQAMTFAEAARKAHADKIAGNVRNAKHEMLWLSSLEIHAFPIIGGLPVAGITQADIKRTLLPIWTSKADTARRVRQRISTVMDWAVVEGHREAANPVAGVENALPAQNHRVKHHAALDWHDLPALMKRLDTAEGTGARALRFAILTAARSGEVRGATWSEVDREGRKWTVPAERMKTHRAHVVPLSDAALDALGTPGEPDALLFPAPRGGQLSDMTLTAVLRRLEVPVTVHGFRATFRNWTAEATAYPREVVETALAHSAAENATEAAYLRSDLFNRRVDLMRDWSRAALGRVVVLPPVAG